MRLHCVSWLLCQNRTIMFVPESTSVTIKKEYGPGLNIASACTRGNVHAAHSLFSTGAVFTHFVRKLKMAHYTLMPFHFCFKFVSHHLFSLFHTPHSLYNTKIFLTIFITSTKEHFHLCRRWKINVVGCYWMSGPCVNKFFIHSNLHITCWYSTEPLLWNNATMTT